MTNPCQETRFTRFPPEMRTSRYSDGPPRIWSYAACFDKPSNKLGGFVEQIHRNAFDACKADDWPDVTCLFDQDRRLLVSGTVQTWTDPDGRAVALVSGQCRRCGSLVLLDPSAEALAQIRVRIAGRRREAA